MRRKDKRSYPRTTTLLPFQVRRLPPNECGSVNCRLSTGDIVIEATLPPPVNDEGLALWLNMINAKLDYLIRLSDPNEGVFESTDFEPLNISGSGMSLIAKERFNKGEILEIKLVLQAYPPKVLYLYGEVVRIGMTPNKAGLFTTGIQFVGLGETALNEILKFDFKKHRERLISKCVLMSRRADDI